MTNLQNVAFRILQTLDIHNDLFFITAMFDMHTIILMIKARGGGG